MKNKRNDFGFFVLVGVCVLAVAFLTGCSSGDNGNSRGNGDDNGPPDGPNQEMPQTEPDPNHGYSAK